MIRFVSILVISLVLFLSCYRTVSTVVLSDSTNVRYIEKVITEQVTLPADSSIVRALFECDSAGNVLILELSQILGERVLQNATFNNGLFVVKANDKATKEIVTITKDSIIERYKEIPVEIIRDKKTSLFYKAKIFALGMLAMFGIVAIKRVLN